MNRTTGSAMIVAGTSIGAGMLALPMVSAATGIYAQLLLMLLMLCLASYGGALIAEACCQTPEAHNLHSLVGWRLGTAWQGITVVATLFLYVSLCSAYIAESARQMDSVLQQFELSPGFELSAILVATATGLLILSGTSIVDWVNRLLMLFMVLLFGTVIILLLPEASISTLPVTAEKASLLWITTPILFTSFGYHCIIPTLVHYLRRDLRKVRIAMFAGSALAFAIYTIWQFAVNGAVDAATINALRNEPNSVNLLIDEAATVSRFDGFEQLITAFTICALMTSFLGVSIGLADYLADALKRSSRISDRTLVLCVTLVPPLVITLLFPGSFVITLGYAAVALIILAILVPMMLVSSPTSGDPSTSVLVRSRGIKAAVIAVSVSIVSAQIALALDWLNL